LSEQVRQYDIVIAGGGMVGSALACALAPHGFHIAVLEAREPQHDWPPGEVDLRVSALTRASQRILRHLGVWQRMVEMRVSPYREMHVWDATGGGSIHFNSAEIGEPDLGHIVENRVTQLALWERLGVFDNVDRLCPAMLDRFERDEKAGEMHVVLQDGAQLRCHLLVGADGRDSRVRELAGITSHGWPYDQHAVVATVRPELWHKETAWQRFMPSGPLAFLPIDDGRCSIVWSTHPSRAEELMALDDDLFLKALTEASERILGEIVEVGPRGVFPLRLQHADQYVQAGLALVGDAAHAVHPLAGQGVNLGFLDATALADVLIEARRKGRNIGSFTILRRYERARKGENMAMLAAMDAFKRLFSNDLLPLRLIRNLGLKLTDTTTPVKHLIMRRALGLSGELPSLAR